MASFNTSADTSLISQPDSNRNRSQAYCTHRTLTRLYDHFNCLKCTLCHRTPDFGYLYCCTQETNGTLPISEFIDETMAIDIADLRVEELPPSGNNASLPSRPSSSFPSTGSFSSQATMDSTGLTVDTEDASDEDLARSFDGKRKFDAAFPPDPACLIRNCGLRVCHTCRPIFRDRAWQSLNQVVDGYPQIPSHYELNNRRISMVNTILGLNTGKYRERLTQEYTFSHGKNQQDSLSALYESRSSDNIEERAVGPVGNSYHTRVGHYFDDYRDTRHEAIDFCSASDADDEKEVDADNDDDDDSSCFSDVADNKIDALDDAQVLSLATSLKSKGGLETSTPALKKTRSNLNEFVSYRNAPRRISKPPVLVGARRRRVQATTRSTASTGDAEMTGTDQPTAEL